MNRKSKMQVACISFVAALVALGAFAQEASEEPMPELVPKDVPAAEVPAPSPHPLNIDPDLFGEDFDPFAEMEEVWKRLDDAMGEAMGEMRDNPRFRALTGLSNYPPIDLVEEGQNYVVRFDLPGLSKEDVEAVFEEGALTVSGESTVTSEVTDGETVLKQERHSGSFERSIVLPGPVNADGMTATMEKGVLTVTLPTKEEVKTRTVIPIQ